MPSLAYLVVDYSPFLLQFGDSNFGIRYYGLGYILGFAIGFWLFRNYAVSGRSQLPVDKIGDFMVALVLGVLVGGRLGYFLLYQIGDLFTHPVALLRVWDGGMSSHGGFIGVTIAMWWFSRSSRIPFLHLADLTTSAAGAGICLVRIANFINGELWGKPATVAWAMIFPRSAAPGTPLVLIPPRHPSQLYESALEGLVLFLFMQWRFWRCDVTKRKPGQLAGEFLIGYAIARVICEVFREPDEGISLLFGLSRGTFYSFFIAATGLVLVLRPRPATARNV
jgi:phosphatidylglycerol:prolipoprotein diacylglycerol transferase